jgi:hypothetical protein
MKGRQGAGPGEEIMTAKTAAETRIALANAQTAWENADALVSLAAHPDNALAVTDETFTFLEDEATRLAGLLKIARREHSIARTAEAVAELAAR